MSGIHRAVSKGTCAKHILHYSDQIASAMSHMTGPCSVCGGGSNSCSHCEVDPRYHQAQSGYCNDLYLSAISGMQTYVDASQLTGPLTSTVVHSPRYHASPERLRGYQYDASVSQCGWSRAHQDVDFRMIQRSEPSGSESTLNQLSSGYNSHSTRLPEAPPCSFMSTASTLSFQSPQRDPNTGMLGPRPDGDGRESSPYKTSQRNINTYVSRESLRSRTSNNSRESLRRRLSRETVRSLEAESRATEPNLPELSIVSEAESFVGKRMCCVALNNKPKASKSIGRKIKDLTKKVGKSSKSSLQTLTVI